jgi:hypothetical protein
MRGMGDYDPAPRMAMRGMGDGPTVPPIHGLACPA